MPMEPKNGWRGMVVPGPKLATIFLRSSGMILERE